MIESARLSNSSYFDLMRLTITEYMEFRTALVNVLEREIEARKG